MDSFAMLVDKGISFSTTGLYAAVAAIVAVIFWYYWHKQTSIPTYGGILSFSRTLSTLRMGQKGRDLLMQAYHQTPIMTFPRPDAWATTVHSKYVEEISRAPEEVLSFMEAAAEMIQTKYTFGPQFAFDHYHIHLIQNQLTRHLSGLFPDVFDESKVAVSEYVDREDGEWNSINVMAFSRNVVTRASNRIFVGLPLCRDPQWLALMLTSAAEMSKVVNFVNHLPAFLRPLAGWYSSNTEQLLSTATKMSRSVVEKKLNESAEESSDDFITWLITSAPERERNVKDITNRVIMTNFVAIHTSSMALTNGLYWLLARPRYLEPLRQEIEDVTSRLGWNKDAIGKMSKLDSFMKECMRVSPFGTQIMSRKVRKPFTFSNGFKPPVGTLVSAHLYATHHDGSIYPQAGVFDGFRFVETRAPGDSEKFEQDISVTKAMYTTSKTYLAFGHGRQACPGRFFAAMEVKLVLAYLIVTYEMKWPDKVYDASNPGFTEEGYRPPDIYHGHRISPNPTAELLIHKRAPK